MHQIVSTRADTSRRWWVLAIVVSAQFMFGVDAFIVNVAIPTIAAELHATPAQIEAVIAIYLIAYATLVVTGGRLGDIHGTRNVFIAGVAGFSVTSLWCGLAQSGPELIVARLAQGATAALMVPSTRPAKAVAASMPPASRAFSHAGTSAAFSPPSDNSRRTTFTSWNAARKASATGPAPSSAAITESRTNPSSREASVPEETVRKERNMRLV
ncbi:hypothetical protein BLN97_42105 [Bradyrhizobium elkanii]|nr:hypothetical protein BLN97_42105 [Bradyrhizobium elkanii]